MNQEYLRESVHVCTDVWPEPEDLSAGGAGVKDWSCSGQEHGQICSQNHGPDFVLLTLLGSLTNVLSIE